MVAFFIEGLAEVVDYFNSISMYVVANFMGCRNSSSSSQRCCCFWKCELHINQLGRLLVGWLVRLVDGWLVVGHHDFLKAQRSCTSRSPIGELVIFNPIHKVLVASSPKFTNNADFSDHFKQEGPSERLRKQSARDGRLERCMHLKSSKPSTRENLIGK